jgi:hypothetical protein
MIVMLKDGASAPLAYDLAISAVPSDAALVDELCVLLAPRLRTMPVWRSLDQYIGSGSRATVVGDGSRVVLVLFQRLWHHDHTTRSDATALRERLLSRPDSVCVMTLDATPLPPWLAEVPRCDLTSGGIQGSVELALATIASLGGALTPARPANGPQPTTRWLDAPPSFLSQPRAQSALRRELDAIADELRPRLALKQSTPPDGTFELLSLPNRLIARFDDVGISFSWIAGRIPTVAEGRLLVIQWSGVTSQRRGANALKSATPGREQVYRVEGTSPESWCWRMDGPNGRAYSTSNLVAEWVETVSLDRLERAS